MDTFGTYALHGLRLRSELALAGFAVDGDEYDVAVRWGPPAAVPDDVPPGRVIAERLLPHRRWYVAVDQDERYMLRVPGHCDFVIGRRLDSVECRPDPGMDPRMVSLLVGGLVVAFVLELAGHCVLHASAVAVNGGAIAFAGDPGMGKSTLAALFCARGARLVTDDVLRLGFSPTVCCIGGSPQLRIRRRAAPVLCELPEAPPTTVTVDDRLAVTPPASGPADHPLTAVVLPRASRHVSAVRLAPLRGAHAVARLVALTRVAGWSDPEVLARQLHALARVADQVPIVEADVPWGPPFDPEVVAALAALAAEEG